MLCLLLFISLSPVFASYVNKTCSKTQAACLDGFCIPLEHKCDGIAHCPDNSDESHALCWENKCAGDQFRCTYGACVNRSAPCNGVPACVDYSDELLPKCRNEHQDTSNKFKCFDNTSILETKRCDGIRHCLDGSDETLWTCAGTTCPGNQFQCAYGACVAKEAACNKVKECADGSDEATALCKNIEESKAQLLKAQCRACRAERKRRIKGNRQKKIKDKKNQCHACREERKRKKTQKVTQEQASINNGRSRKEKCLLPSYPAHGTYSTQPKAKPGDALKSVVINVTCEQGYGVNGSRSVHCDEGWWSEQIPQCIIQSIYQCHLMPHPSIDYYCMAPGSAVDNFTPCREYERAGTVVRAHCKRNYHSRVGFPDTRCIDGTWTDTAKCIQDCGTFGPPIDLTGGFGGDVIGGLGTGGTDANLGDLPWHAAIYSKTTKPYKQICGGSLISKKVIISAAHCFWSNVEGKQLPAANYAAAVGKLHRPWNDQKDDGQKSDIKEVYLPVKFQGSTANYQDDIAVVVVTTKFEYKWYIGPVCLDFDYTFDKDQLEMGKKLRGKVAGWGLTNVRSFKASQTLTVLELPYVDTKTCIAESPTSFRALITSDKICAGFKDKHTAVCQGDSGGGLVFLERDKWVERYYLRGIVSTAPEPDEEDTCNDNTYTAFTQLQKHEHFIKQFWNPYD